MFAHIFKNNPYHDAQGRFTSKEKASHQHDKLTEMAQQFNKVYGNFPDFAGVLASAAAKSKLDAMASMYIKYSKNKLNESGAAPPPFSVFDKALPGDPMKASLLAGKVKALAAGQKAKQAKQAKLAKTTGAQQSEPPKPAVNMIPVAGGDNSKSAKSKQAWKKIYMGKSLKAMPDAVDQYIQQIKAVQEAPSAYVKKKEEAKLSAMQKKLAFLHDQYVSNGGDSAHYEDLVAKATNAAVKKLGSLPPMMAVPPVSAPKIGKTVVVEYKPHSTKTDELLQNQMLGVQYYTLRDQLGKDHADTQKAYGEWQKSKDSLKTLDPGVDIASLSYKAKQQWEQQKAASAPPPAPTPAQVSTTPPFKTTASKLKEAYSHAYAVAYNAEMGNSGAVANASTMLASLSADIVKSNPSYKSLLDDAIKKAEDMAVTAAKASVDAKPLPSGGTYHEISGSYSSSLSPTLVDKNYRDHSQAQAALLSSLEKNAVSEYTGSGFTAINKAAVYGTKDLDVNSQLTNLESAINKVTLGENLTLYRTAPSKWFLQAMGLGEANSEVSLDDLKSVVGKVYVERAFSSTTRKSSMVSSYTSTVDKSGRVRFTIRAPSTAKALETSHNDLSGNPSEWEVILQRNSMLYVRSVSKDAKQINVEVDLVGVHHD